MGLIIRSSDIHAAGCYTTAPISTGTRIVEYTGHRITKDAADELYAEKPYTYLFGVGDGSTVIDGHGTAMFINHCCDPNCETQEDDNGRVWVIAIRDIVAGEELTYDYCLYDGDGEELCYCGAQNCRGTMYSEEEIRRRKRAERAKAKNAKAKKQTRNSKSRKKKSTPFNGKATPCRNGRDILNSLVSSVEDQAAALLRKARTAWSSPS